MSDRDSMFYREFARMYPNREQRRALTVEEAYVAGARRAMTIYSRVALRRERRRTARAFLLGLRRGYRLAP